MPEILWPLKMFIATVERDLSLGLAIYGLFAISLYGTVDLVRRSKRLFREAVAAHRERLRRAGDMERVARTHFDLMHRIEELEATPGEMSVAREAVPEDGAQPVGGLPTAGHALAS